jgi:hypothetical protein
MDQNIFKKMRLKPQMTGRYFFAPEAYVKLATSQDYIDFGQHDHPDFIHLFVTSKREFDERIASFLSYAGPQTKIWISYLKSTPKHKYDINRDAFFIFAEDHDLIPNANVALDEAWSCVGFKKK